MGIEIKVEGRKLYFSGSLDEDTKKSLIMGCIDNLIEPTAREPIYFDFEGVRRTNSSGLHIWRDCVSTITEGSEQQHRSPPTALYIHTPKLLIDQMNMNSELITKHVYVASFFAPYCEVESGHFTNFLLKVGEDVLPGREYSEDELIIRKGNEIWEPNYESEEYFFFLQAYSDMKIAITGKIP